MRLRQEIEPLKCRQCGDYFLDDGYSYDDEEFCCRKCLGQYIRVTHVTGGDAYEEGEEGFTWHGETFDSEEELEDYMVEELEDKIGLARIEYVSPEEEFYQAVDYYWGR